ncbi:MAG: phosphonopyruvate decarboxylase, partial [Helicobacter sp.]|nr:phosphonopyruvate decarboxylase [Helicobacter sp.]
YSYELGDLQNQLYMVGSMGCVGTFGVGIAQKSSRKVIAIDGDGAALMRLGAFAMNAQIAREKNAGNFCHILLDNQSHDSTGGQQSLSPFVDFAAVARACGYAHARLCANLEELEREIQGFLAQSTGGAVFLALRIQRGSKKDLSRPKITPREVAERLFSFLGR